jgi:hypothetical protein
MGAPAGYEEVAPPPAGYEAVPPPTGLETTSTGIVVPQGAIGPSVVGPDSFAGGLIRRGVAAVQGLGQTFGPPREDENAFTSIPGVRIARGLYEGIKTAGAQAMEQGKGALEAAKVGAYPEAALRGAQAVTTGISALDPLATGSVTNINKLESEGRNREALGAGTFDALTMLAGRKLGKEPASKTTLNKLAYATGAENIRPLDSVIPELKETIAQQDGDRA